MMAKKDKLAVPTEEVAAKAKPKAVKAPAGDYQDKLRRQLIARYGERKGMVYFESGRQY